MHSPSPTLSRDSQQLIHEIQTLPEAEALERYARLSTVLQWMARRQVTGARRSALILHHVTIAAGRA
jgi:hypothetical protein